MDKAEAARERARLWYANNKARAKKARADYYRANTEAAKARAQKHADKNRDAIRVIAGFRRMQDPQKYTQYVTDYYKRNPDKKADGKAVRRAREKKLFVEKVSREIVYYRGRMKCHMCKKKIKLHEMHVDHVIPLAKGGKHCYDNCRPACPGCNQRKGAR